MSADGSVVLDVNMNISQANKQLAKLKQDIAKTEQQITEITQKRDAAKRDSIFKAAELDNEKLKLEELKQALDELKTTAKDKSLGTSTIEELKSQIPGAAEAVKEQQERVRILQTEYNRVYDSVDRYDQKLKQLTADLDAQKTAAGTMEQSIAEESRSLREAAESAQVADQHIVDLTVRLRELRARQAELEAAGIGFGYEEYDQIVGCIAEINDELGDYADGLSDIADDTDDVSDETKRLGILIGAITERIKTLMASVFVFNVISSAFGDLHDWLEAVVKSNDEASAAIARLKGALLTLVQPLVEIIIPAFTFLANILARIVTIISGLVSALFGKTLQQSSAGAKALYEEANAIESVGNAADKAAGSLAGFDEINTISTENADSGAGAGGSGGIDSTAPNFAGYISTELDKIAMLVGAALLAVGAILTFSGANIPLGIALMAAGAVTLAGAISENWDEISELMKGPIGRVTTLISGALLALGAILAFSGASIPLGAALMALGAVGLVTVVAANWNAIVTAMRGPIGLVTALVSGALLAIGLILAFSGINIPLGIALMAAGAIGLATYSALNWDTVSQILQGPIGIVVALVSGALIVLGALLLFSGAFIPLGIALIAVGAAGLVTPIIANWETIQNLLEGPIGEVISIVSAALLALGAVLLFSGAGIPLGLGLLVVGAVGLATSIVANWETIQEALSGPIGAVTLIASTALLALGVILLFTGVGIALGLGLIVVGATGLAMAVIPNWETVQEALSGPIGIVTTIASAALLALGVILLFTGAGIPLGLGLIAVGALGLAAAIVPNWDFLLNKLKEAWTNITNWWNTDVAKFFTWGYWEDTGNAIIDALLAGLKFAWEAVMRWANPAVGNLISLFNSANSKAQSVIPSAQNVSKPSKTLSSYSLPDISTMSIPRLAAGAVIPANREFMAVLGDQSHGNNLEGPESLFRQIVREESGVGNTELAQILQTLQSISSAIKDGHVIMVDGQTFGRTAIKTINSVNTAAGKQLLLI